MSKTLQAIKFDRSDFSLEILDQLLLPYSTTYIPITSIDDAYSAISSMQVRGAPAIAIVGAFAIAMECKALEGSALLVQLLEKIEYLFSSRPTAVNLGNAIDEITKALSQYDVHQSILPQHTKIVSDYAIKLHGEDLANNFKIGDNGLEYIKRSLEAENFSGPFSIMTICNTGSLATSGHGTALGIIRTAHKHLSDTKQKFWLEKVYPCETRPYNQGAKLTTYELDYEKIPFSLICDNMVSSLITSVNRGKSVKQSSAPVKFIIVGADRIVKNGDTANKIGTFQLSVIANHFNNQEGTQNIKFIVAAPKTTIDFHSETGDEIKIEERPAEELTTLKGPVLENGKPGEKKVVGIATPGISVWNPAFDVTPYDLIDSIVTEYEVLTKDQNGEFKISQ